MGKKSKGRGRPVNRDRGIAATTREGEQSTAAMRLCPLRAHTQIIQQGGPKDTGKNLLSQNYETQKKEKLAKKSHEKKFGMKRVQH